MKNLISRRKFVISAMTALTVVGSAGFWVRWKNTKETDITEAILKRRLGGLKIDPQAFKIFSNEMIEHRKSYAKQLKVLGMFSGLLSLLTPYNFLPMGHPIRRLENYSVSNFLLATDFFQNGADINREVKYLGFYDPYKRPCVNFFIHD